MITGNSLIWFLTTFPLGTTGMETYAGEIGSLFQPFMNPLGTTTFLTVTLLVGFVAKELQLTTLTVIYGLNSELLTTELQRTTTFAQGFSFCLFSLLYIPCLTTIGTIWNESKSFTYTAFSIVLPLCIAWLFSFLFYQLIMIFNYS